MKDKTFKFDLNVQAWINGIEIPAETYDEALEGLRLMSLDDLIENGYVKNFEITKQDFTVEHEEEEDDNNDEQVAWQRFIEDDDN